MPGSRFLLAVATAGGLSFAAGAILPAAAQLSSAPKAPPLETASADAMKRTVAAVENLYLKAGGTLAPGSSAADPRIVPTAYNQVLLEFMAYGYSSAGKPSLDAALARCRAAPDAADCDPRARLSGEFIDAVKPIADLRLKAELVNAFVNILIDYDAARVQLQRELFIDYFYGNGIDQTPRETLTRDLGACADQSLLKIDLLKRVGFPERQIYLMEGDDYQYGKDGRLAAPGGHAVVNVTIGGALYILDNQQLPLSRADFQNAGGAALTPRQRAILSSDAALLQPGLGKLPGGKMALDFGHEFFSPAMKDADGRITPLSVRDFAALPAEPGAFQAPFLETGPDLPRKGAQHDRIVRILVQAFAQNIDNPSLDAPYRGLDAPPPHRRLQACRPQARVRFGRCAPG